MNGVFAVRGQRSLWRILQVVVVEGLNLTLYDAADTKCAGEGTLLVVWKDGVDADIANCSSVEAKDRFGNIHGIAECYGASEPVFPSGIFWQSMTFRLTRRNITGQCDPWSDGIWYFTPAGTEKLLGGECAPMYDFKDKEHLRRVTTDKDDADQTLFSSHVRLSMPVRPELHPPCDVLTTSTFITTEPPIINTGGVQKFLPFRPSGLSDAGRHQCRRTNRFDDADSYYALYGDGDNIDVAIDDITDCEEKCMTTPGCTAIEHSSFGRCEVWTVPVRAVAEIAQSGPLQGVMFDCYIYTPSLRDVSVCRDLPAEVVRVVSTGRYDSCDALKAAGACPVENGTEDTNALYCPLSCDLCELRATTTLKPYESVHRVVTALDLSAACGNNERWLFVAVGVLTMLYSNN